MTSNIGRVTHYFDHIQVAALSLADKLSVGDTVQIGTLRQVVNSMQINHQSVQTAKAGDDVAIKVDVPVKVGDAVERV